MLTFVLMETGCTLDGEVVAFGGSAGPDDFFWIGIDQCCDFSAGIFNGLFVARAGSVAEILIKERNHLVDDTGIDRSGRRIIKVNRELHD
jgi:hypothetical protein